MEWTFDVDGLVSGETVVDASMEIRTRLGAVVVPNRSISSVENSHGKITVTDGRYTLYFKLTPSETSAFNTQEVYYVFNVYINTSTGRKQFLVPLGEIFPTQVIATAVRTKIAASHITLSMTARVIATKQ